MELQISHSICTKISKKSILWGKESGHWENIKTALRMERNKKILEAEACPDHIHLFVEIPPKISVSSFMGYLKGKSSTMIYEQFGDLKYKYRNRSFWCKGYYVDTVGKNERRIAEYIRHQLDEDKLGEQLSIPETEKYRKKRK